MCCRPVSRAPTSVKLHRFQPEGRIPLIDPENAPTKTIAVFNGEGAGKASLAHHAEGV